MHERHEHSHQLKIWFCGHCDYVHFRTANITLDFSKREFLAFSDAMLGILRREFTDEDLRTVKNFVGDNDDILSSDTVI